MEKIIKRDGSTFKVKIIEFTKDILNEDYRIELIQMYTVDLYRKRESKKWYHFSNFELVHSIEFKKSKWEGKFIEMSRNVLKVYDNVVLSKKRKQVIKEKGVEEFKKWDGSLTTPRN